MKVQKNLLIKPSTVPQLCKEIISEPILVYGFTRKSSFKTEIFIVGVPSIKLVFSLMEDLIIRFGSSHRTQ